MYDYFVEHGIIQRGARITKTVLLHFIKSETSLQGVVKKSAGTTRADLMSVVQSNLELKESQIV